MPGISDALYSSVNHMLALERSLAVIQSNVGNASTPGYVRQDLVSIDSPSVAGALQQVSSRDEYAEQAVRQQNSLLGRYDQISTALGFIEPNFGAGADAEIPKAVGALFATFSALTADPNGSGARQLVLDRAAQLGRTFNSAAVTLQKNEAEARHQVSVSVDSVNRLSALVRQFNVNQAESASTAGDAAVEAKLYDSLERLSEVADVQLIRQNDGSISLFLDGQTALVVGESFYPIQADLTSGPSAIIRDSAGTDITSQLTGGRLGGALEAANKLLPGYQSSLDRLAKGLADTVNATLAAGIDWNGNPGAPLFTYSGGTVAATLAIAPLTTSQLAAASAGAPGGNGGALALSALETTPTVNGLTFAGFYGSLVAAIGRDVADASDNTVVQKQLLAQARSQRSDSSGVSLDEEAILLIEYQRAYQAAAKVVSVLDELSQTTLNMIN